MIRMILIVSALIAGLILGPEISENKGYILLSFDSYTTYETTIINACFIALIFYFLLLIAEWLLRRLLSMNSLTRGWFGQRKTKKAQKNSLLGMFALFEGNNKQAYKLLSNSAQRSEAPSLTHIGAARAAHLQGLYDLRDDHLQLAGEVNKAAELAAGLVWVELQLDAKQYENALATLQELAIKFPKNKRIALLFLDIYPALDEWKLYIQTLNEQRKSLAYNDLEFATLELNAYQHFFTQLAADSPDMLKLYWDNKAPRWMRKELSYQKAVLDAFISTDHGKFAQAVLLEKLNKQFSLPLLAYLDKVVVTDHYPLILLLEKKLNKEKETSLIHQALAKLKLKEDNPIAAIKHLEQSLETVPNAEDFALIAELLEKQDRHQEATSYYRQGLILATTKNTAVTIV
ncbi:heme biosynthesis protein HemY [Psychromonas sp. psych-6C06]|uniref:heme biosynthesis HemY N-terminal domain-containing protein n=1 Tax=Psychromonas sp. psych-6C06 TaxID=2058089 RepID=UPI000C32C6D4|nr:heme biosynthesis HemY N-terminal domain-containing protein [Psychromonas sp. psych-6C06]PKF61395.1 heme biosynthesis protein HemY [Psychromonas sp. psych-6C06]